MRTPSRRTTKKFTPGKIDVRAFPDIHEGFGGYLYCCVDLCSARCRLGSVFEVREDNIVIEKSAGAMCQSCGMPLGSPADLGTAADGTHVSEFCRYCFQKGAFTNPDMTMPAMIDLCVGVLSGRGMPEPQARAMMTGVIPTLARWRRL